MRHHHITVFLGGIMKACNNVAQSASEVGSPIFCGPSALAEAAPGGFPYLTLTTMRALCALSVLHPGREAGKSGAAGWSQ
ncbi:unnamed protein product [Diplocarpon coronariae]|nr:2-hydroxychromene-2-carboxylate isomerase [Diplocarpon mali]